MARTAEHIRRLSLAGHEAQFKQRKQLKNRALIGIMRAENWDDETLLRQQWKLKKPLVCPNTMCSNPMRKKWYKVSNRKMYAHHCGYQIAPLSGTIFHNSRIPLSTWYMVLAMLESTDNKISIMEIQREIKTTYKAAQRIKRILTGML